MKLTDQHRALLITFLISGTIVLSVFNFNIKKQQERIAETYYELEPEKELTEEEIKILEALDQLNGSKAETNKGFNETVNHKQFAQAYKTIEPPKDYENPLLDANRESTALTDKKAYEPEDSGIEEEEISKFSKVNDLLKQQKNEGANTKSTMSYSLVDRTDIYLPTPIYLCEEGGKIVVNITVNANGDVTDAYVNTSSTSSNECLIDHALEYAKEARFSANISKPTQLGSITFYFIGKY
ncbi:energy transducer TonB [Yeosuana sp. MJ-SS3]|uniref:Energy transducer TonB n=1 Tax=Gilvirhabdus luticola TaxID=3079858 RepID=A0ABU3U3N0_9FLAO|nr:energy transducer TonB [Yeosuana sp. MJ-SS3]MDU8884937.1 energy transducer TonB [Yeosuana sp. MJ-SS3]